ncbi:MAG: hypothetical protein QOK46_915, partial [Microbacteriaceae bacterium]|nr:hypothetical protein [Microbacteriaceae bacterium]
GTESVVPGGSLDAVAGIDKLEARS